VVFGLTRSVHVRGAGGFYSYDTTYDDTGVRYDGTADLRNVIVTLDLHPGGSAFRLSLGGAWDDNRLEVTAPARELVRRERPDLLPRLPNDLGTLRGEATGDRLAPYAGIGWGRPFAGGRFAASVDLGVLYHGQPEVDLALDLPAGVTVPGTVQPVLDAVTEDEERRLEESLRDYEYLPVIAFGITFRL
jgi:hypothetical protein